MDPTVAAPVAAGVLVVALGTHLLLRALERRTETKRLVRKTKQAWWAMMGAVALWGATLLLPVEEGYKGLRALGQLLVIGTAAWLTIRASLTIEDAAYRRYRVDMADNRVARKKRTQVHLVRRISAVAVVVIAAAAAVATFSNGKTLATLLASAGVIGAVVGFSAQTTLANLAAGVQVAFTDVLRIDDVVVVENEWGKIEDITLTYVVVRIWDERTLVLPVSYFVSRPFQHWTRKESQIVGSVEVHADHTVDVPGLREALEAYLPQHPLWDGRVQVLQVTETSPGGVTLRALVSSKNPEANWDLRCDVREHLTKTLATRQPGALPKVRHEGKDPRRRAEMGEERWRHERSPGTQRVLHAKRTSP